MIDALDEIPSPGDRVRTAIGEFQNHLSAHGVLEARPVVGRDHAFDVRVDVAGRADDGRFDFEDIAFGEKGADIAKLDGEAAFDLAVDNTGDHFVRFVGRFQFLPGFGALGFLTRQLGLTETVFYGIECDFDFIPYGNAAFALVVLELFYGDDSLGLEAGTDDYDIVVYRDNGTGDDRSRLYLLTGKTLFK